MKDPKECEKLLELSDAMIQVQGIILVEHGLRLLQWNNAKELQNHFEVLENTLDEIIKECTQEPTTDSLYRELGGER
ncbi:hypothetical protein N9355_01065 [Crocinitomicaceae bacterium]|nr:hypothetical protein [Crocinitomicaceae bacterium]